MPMKMFSVLEMEKYLSEQEKTEVVSSSECDEIPECPNTQNGQMGNCANDYGPGVFPEEVYSSIPYFLKKVVMNSISEEDREIMLLGALACLSACFSNVCGVYDERVVYPNLYLFVVADAGMGKGSLTMCRSLVEPINVHLHELAAQQEREYREAMNCKGDVQLPPEPKMLMLIIPANSSSSSFLKILSDNDGKGLLFETEGDTLSQTLRSDFGNYSDTMRKAYHHEQVSMSRRKDREFCMIETPRLSIVLAGTPGQVASLIPCSENGLMSRFMFYNMPFKRSIRDVFSTDDIALSKQTMFKQLGEELCCKIERFQNLGQMSFVIPKHLRGRFVEFLNAINDKYCERHGNGMQGVVRRMGLMTYRIMMILTAVRKLDCFPDSETGNHVLTCTDDDFETALMITDTLIGHSAEIYSSLTPFSLRGTTGSSVTDRKLQFYDTLPLSFTRKEFDEQAVRFGYNIRTVSKWIDFYVSGRMLERTGQGNYRKTVVKSNDILS